MKVLKYFFVKRVFVIMLCTAVLSSTVFLSYENTMVVKAVDESNLIYDFVVAALAAVGVFATGGTAGALALAIAPALAASGKDIYDYVTENEDGTTTISADLVNLVLQAYKEYIEQNFDGTLNYDDDSMYYDYGETVWKLYQPGQPTVTTVISSFNYAYPFAILFKNGVPYRTSSTRKQYTCEFYFYNGNPESANGGIALANDYKSLVLDPKPDPFQTTYINGQIVESSNSFVVYSIITSTDGVYATISSSTVPIYTNYDQMVSDFHSNKFDHAENYSPGVSSGQTSSYTGEYTGGDITVDTEKLNDISDKLAELEESNSNIEDTLKELLEWLKLNGGGSGGGDVIVDVDLTETNSWLSKIFQKLDEFNENFKSFFIFKDAPGINAKYISSILERILEQLRGTGQVDPGEPEDPDGSDDSIIEAALAKIQKSIEDLNAMLQKYLKSISSDLGDLKDQLEDMSEQEFSDQTESFLDDTMDSFWEISEKAKGKFPFSIPNDIRLLISKMSVSQPEDPGQGTYSVMTMAYDEDVGNNSMILVLDERGDDVPIISETGAPIFYLPFVIASAGIEEFVLIDLSGFEPVSSFCRSLMTIWFILCLYNLTFKVMGLWGDLVD